MGIENRDYIRTSGPTFGGGFSGGGFSGGGYAGGDWAIKYILIANAIVFVLQYVTANQDVLGITGQLTGGVTDLLSLKQSDIVPRFQLWRLLTYGFCHGGLWHIVINMYVLWMFGRNVAPIYGSREFLAFYLAGVLTSGVCHMLVPGEAGVIGASGGVMAVTFLCAMHFPRMTILLMMVIPVQLRFLAVIYAAADLFGYFNPAGSHVAHAAHLGGAAFGVAYKYFGWRVLPLLNFVNWSRVKNPFKRKPKLRIHRPSGRSERNEQNLDAQVDAILTKINEQGESSLTDAERAILTEASRHYRNRP